MTDHTRPDESTREADDAAEHTPHEADRPPTPDEEEAADANEPDPEVGEHYRDMGARGAAAKGEGRID